MFRPLQRPATLFGFVPATRASAPTGQMHRPRVRGSQGTAEEIPRLFPPAPWQDDDAAERAYNDAINRAEAARDYAKRVNFNAYPREAWEGPLLDIYTVTRLYRESLAEFQAIMEGRAAQAADEARPVPVLNSRTIASLREGVESAAYAERVADALLLGVKDVGAERIKAARDQAHAKGADGQLAAWLERMAQIAASVPQAAQELAERAGTAVGTGFREAAKASLPWGPIIVGGFGLIGLALLIKKR